jgi:hypothetical protein
LSETGTYYYRIKVVDKDGRATYSVIRSVDFVASGKITVAPNPFTSHVTIRGAAMIKSITVMDISGRVLRTIDCDNNATVVVTLHHLPAGVYTLRLQKKDGTSVVHKITRN